MRSFSSNRPKAGFTLIEMLVVISIIAVLAGLLFPVVSSALDRAKNVQAKNDVTQIVNAINAFYTEYGQYPCGPSAGSDASEYFNSNGSGTSGGGGVNIWDTLRAESGANTYNTRAIPFLQPPIAKDITKPKSGIGGDGIYYDPWGSFYRLKMDNNYNNQIENPYTSQTGAGFDVLNLGAIAWSLGKDVDGAKTGTKGNGGPKNSGTGKDDIISWQ